MVALLLERGAVDPNVETTDEGHRFAHITALWYAITTGWNRNNRVKLLLQHGASCRACWLFACDTGQTEIVEMMVRACYDTTVVGLSGRLHNQTGRQLAGTAGHSRTVELLDALEAEAKAKAVAKAAKKRAKNKKKQQRRKEVKRQAAVAAAAASETKII